MKYIDQLKHIIYPIVLLIGIWVYCEINRYEFVNRRDLLIQKYDKLSDNVWNLMTDGTWSLQEK